jgi:hypothetical protein
MNVSLMKHEADKGTAAGLWQVLMVGHVPVVAYFALKWLPKSPEEARARAGRHNSQRPSPHV